YHLQVYKALVYQCVHNRGLISPYNPYKYMYNYHKILQFANQMENVILRMDGHLPRRLTNCQYVRQKELEEVPCRDSLILVESLFFVKILALLKMKVFQSLFRFFHSFSLLYSFFQLLIHLKLDYPLLSAD